MGWLLQRKPQKTGTSQKQGANGTASTITTTAKTCCMPSKPCNASNVEVSLSAGQWPSSALQPAKPETFAKGIRVIRVEPAGRGDTGCITVMERHNFALANGVIVANCWDATRYGVMRRRRNPDEQISGDPEEPTYKHDNDTYTMKV